MRIVGVLVVIAVLTMACETTSDIIATPTASSSRGPLSPPPGESPIVNVPTQGVPSTISPTRALAPTQAPAEPPTEAPVAPPAIIATEPAATSGGSACAAGCTSESPACAIKGNITSSHERIYHVPGDRDYGRTKIDPENGERWFCTTAEAEANGWRHARQ